jgi:flagellar biogenesis protein FliO
MSRRREFLIFVLGACFLLTGFHQGLSADSAMEEVLEAEVALEDAPKQSQGIIIQPKAPGNRSQIGGGSAMRYSTIWAVYGFLFLVSVLALFLWFQRKGGLGIPGLQQNRDLKLLETKSLGNRQFLIVVQYGEQKMLLGVTPGQINHLCYLEDGAESGQDSLSSGSR